MGGRGCFVIWAISRILIFCTESINCKSVLACQAFFGHCFTAYFALFYLLVFEFFTACKGCLIRFDPVRCHSKILMCVSIIGGEMYCTTLTPSFSRIIWTILHYFCSFAWNRTTSTVTLFVFSHRCTFFVWRTLSAFYDWTLSR